MKQRCPTAKLLGTGRIENYTLLFRGPCQEDTFLTVEPKQGSFVPVAAFSVEPSDVKALDDYEDVENNLYYAGDDQWVAAINKAKRFEDKTSAAVVGARLLPIGRTTAEPVLS